MLRRLNLHSFNQNDLAVGHESEEEHQVAVEIQQESADVVEQASTPENITLLGYEDFIRFAQKKNRYLKKDELERLWFRTIGSYGANWRDRRDYNSTVNGSRISSRAAEQLLNSLPQLSMGLARNTLPPGFTLKTNPTTKILELDVEPLKRGEAESYSPMAVRLIPTPEDFFETPTAGLLKPLIAAPQSRWGGISRFVPGPKTSTQQPHVLLDSLKENGHLNLCERLLVYAEKLSLTLRDVNVLQRLYQSKNEKGLNDLFDQWEEHERRGILGESYQYYFSKSSDYSKTLSEDESGIFKSWAALKIQNPNKYHWWCTLIGMHMQAVPYDHLKQLFRSFLDFSRYIEEWNLTFPPECLHTNITSLPTALSHMLTILGKCSQRDRGEQWKIMHELDLSSTGAVAYSRETNSPPRFITPEMNITTEVYFQKTLDPRKGSVETIYRVVDIMTKADAWRCIAEASDAARLSFYRKAFKLLDKSTFSELKLRGMTRLLVGTTTGENTRKLADNGHDEPLLDLYGQIIDLVTPNIVIRPAMAAVLKLMSDEAFLRNNDFCSLKTTVMLGNFLFKYFGTLGLAAFQSGALKIPSTITNALELFQRMSDSGYEAELLRGMRFYGGNFEEASLSMIDFLSYSNVLMKLFVDRSKLDDPDSDDLSYAILSGVTYEEPKAFLVENVSTFKLDSEKILTVSKAIEAAHLDDVRIKFLRQSLALISTNKGLTHTKLIAFIDEFSKVSTQRSSALELTYKTFKNNFPSSVSIEQLDAFYDPHFIPDSLRESLTARLKAHITDTVTCDNIMALFDNCEYSTRDESKYTEAVHMILSCRDQLGLNIPQWADFIEKLGLFSRHNVSSLIDLLAEIKHSKQLAPLFFMSVRVKQVNKCHTPQAIHAVANFYRCQNKLGDNKSLIHPSMVWMFISDILRKSPRQSTDVVLDRLYMVLDVYKDSDIQSRKLIIEFFEKAIQHGPGPTYFLRDMELIAPRMSCQTLESLIIGYDNECDVLVKLFGELSQIQNTSQCELLLKVMGLLANQSNKRVSFHDFMILKSMIESNEKEVEALYSKLPYPAVSQLEQYLSTGKPLETEPVFKGANLILGLGLTQDDLDSLSELSKSVAEKTTEELQQELDKIKLKSPEYILVYVLTLLKRSIDITLNTTQIQTLYASLKNGKRLFAQIDTGEGKSRIMMVMAACKALQGKTVDFVTSNMQLARRDKLEYADFFSALKIPVRLIHARDSQSSYLMNGINFSDPAELRLFRNKLATLNSTALGLNPDSANRVLLADEVDKLILDTPERFNFATSSNREASYDKNTWIYPLIVKFLLTPIFNDQFLAKDDGGFFINDLEGCNQAFREWVSIDSNGQYHVDSLKRISDQQLESWYPAAVIANHLKEGEHFTLEYDAPILTPEGMVVASHALLRQNSRIARHSQYSRGVHQFIHAWLNHRRLKHQLKGRSVNYLGFHIEPERNIVYSASAKHLIQDYQEGEIFGATGSLGNGLELNEISTKYSVGLMAVPRHQENRRVDHPIQLVGNVAQQYKAVLDLILSSEKTPFLFVCIDDTKAKSLNNYLSLNLTAERKAQITVVNAATHADQEAKAIAHAGKDYTSTVSTLMLARGADIKSNRLKTVLLFLADSREMIQARGRSGRNGQDGSTHCILAKTELKRQLGVDSLHRSKHSPVSFYKNPEQFIAYHQAKMSKIKSTDRLISEAESDFRKDLTDKFYKWFLSNEFEDPAQIERCWASFLHTLDDDWSVAQQSLRRVMSDFSKPSPDKISDTFSQYYADANERWKSLEASLEVHQVENFPAFPAALPTIEPSLINQEFDLHVTHDQKSHDKYHPEFAGRTVIYSRVFEETRSMSLFGGQRRFFDNTRAWWNGHGILFANTRATLTGDRAIFANVRASRKVTPQ